MSKHEFPYFPLSYRMILFFHVHLPSILKEGNTQWLRILENRSG